MSKVTQYFVSCWVFVAVSLFPDGLEAAERILNYNSDITIATDGSMTVAETIRVQAEGAAIRRGIYRDFPTRYRDRLGNRVVVDFNVLGVTRDGSTEPFLTERISNGVRVYVGDEGTLLAPGQYSYTIRYRTDRQLGFFENHDELYWNVTGNGLAFVIDQASATVSLPGDVSAQDITMEGFTGRFGVTEQAYSSEVFDGGASIQTTSSLLSQAGLTLVMTWPKGVITEPTAVEQIGFILGDNLGLLLSLATLALVMAYLFTTWSRHGRDPEAGVIFPHYEPPPGYSPASARYISRMGYDNKSFSAAIVNLAVKGYLKIEQAGKKDYTLTQESSTKSLAPGERTLLKKLFKKGPVVELDNKNHSLISKARTAHSRALRNDYLNIYFKKNSLLILPSLVMLIVLIAAIAAFSFFTVVVVVVIGIIIVLMAVFLFLLKAPTSKGRLLMDKLEGFKLYLEVAEKDELNIRHPPDLTPELFEQYLPFAIALGVEQAWADQFTQVFANIEAKQQSGYHPVWYHGNFSSMDLGGFASDVGSSFNSAISSAATAPGSSSGAGGGGFSGGGGGGGGGGGW